MRLIEISRSDAEHIIDLLEAEAIPEYMDIVDELRVKFGMPKTTVGKVFTMNDHIDLNGLSRG